MDPSDRAKSLMPGAGSLLRRLGVAFERTRAVFTPVGHGHRHD